MSVRADLDARRRRSGPRPKVVSVKHLTKLELRADEVDYPDVDRPKTRGECLDAPRPCPFVSCKHHLYLDLDPRSGSIKLNHPTLEPWELEHTCSLDEADRGGMTLDLVGKLLNLTRERIRQVETRALLTLRPVLAKEAP